MTNVKQLKHSQFIGNLYLFQHGIEFYREPRGLGVFILNMLQNSNNCFALVSTYTNTLFSKGHFYRLHLNLVLSILSSCMKEDVCSKEVLSPGFLLAKLRTYLR